MSIKLEILNILCYPLNYQILMRDRLMVGHAPLEGGIMVRVHVPQQI